MRLTRDVRQQLLDQNEGFEARSDYSAKNITVTTYYRISGGQLYMREKGKTSWADSRFDQERVASDDQTHRFLRKYLWELNTNGLK